MDAPSPLLSLILNGKYAEAITAHAGLLDPTPEDDRWAGLCLFNTGRALDARDVLLRAIGRGCRAAAIELATVYRQLGDAERARELLCELATATLEPFDAALYERERGVTLRAAGELAAASVALERAWAAACAAPLGDAVLPGIALTLALVHSARGRDSRALHHLSTAIDHANAPRRARLLVARAACLTHAGRYNDAARDLDRADELAPDGATRPVALYTRAELLRTRGLYGDAAALYAAASAASRVAEQPETECYAELGAAAVATAAGDIVAARRHVSRARALADDTRLRALCDLRDGAALTRAGARSAPERLQRAAGTFDRLGLLREAGWAQLHLAEAFLAAGRRADGDAALMAAADRRNALGDTPALAGELRDLPRVLDRLAELERDHGAAVFLLDWDRLDGAAPLCVDVRTLGAAAIHADGRAVHVNAGLARAVALIAFLTLNPNRTLEQVQTALFPDADPRRSKGYFHVLRAEVERCLAGIRIPFAADDRTYAVQHAGVRLRLDVVELRRALSAGGEDGVRLALELYKGPFLPFVAGEWAETERDDVEWSMVRVGLETVEDLFERGEYSKCVDLAGKLLQVTPLNEALNAYLVRATSSLRGAVAARRELERACARFRDEVGDVPPELERLERELHAVN